MRLNISTTALIEVPVETPALLQIEAISTEGLQTVERQSIVITPEPRGSTSELVDLYGNPCRKVIFQAGVSRIEYAAVVSQSEERMSTLLTQAETDVINLDPISLHFLLPSRYCASDRLTRLAADMFLQHKPGYARVLAICQWINEHVAYEYGVSNASTSGIDTLLERRGVCRDFAHLAISLCRALTIPARYVSGYCLNLQTPDFHAYFQAYIDGRWVSFDATELQPRPSLLQVAVGRDAADCAWCTMYGPGSTLSLTVDVQSVS